MSTTPCQNCGTPLQGPFCHHCGQRDVDLRTSFWALFQEWGSNSVRLDSRLLRTLPGFLLHPHRLARAYVDGQRHRYTPPMRLILSCFSIGVVLLLLATRVTVDELAQVAVVEQGTFVMDAPGLHRELSFDFPEDSTLGRKLHTLETETTPAFATRVVLQVVLRATSLSTMLLIPVLAVLLRTVNRRSWMVEHLLFSALAHGAVFLVFVVATLFSAPVGSAAVLLLPVYVARHQWALAPGEHAWNALKTVLVLAIHLVASWFTYLIAIVIGIYRL